MKITWQKDNNSLVGTTQCGIIFLLRDGRLTACPSQEEVKNG